LFLKNTHYYYLYDDEKDDNAAAAFVAAAVGRSVFHFLSSEGFKEPSVAP